MRMTRTSRIAALLVAAAMLVALPLAGCAKTDPAATDAAAEQTAPAVFPVTVTDDAGREVTVQAEPQRIVSLAPANTEIVYALDGGLDRLVGVTTYDDYPAEVADIEKMGDFVTPNLEAIAAAQPDLVLATTGVQADVIKQLEDLGAMVVAIDPQNLEQLYTSIETVGAVTGRAEEATTIVRGMESDLADIAETISAEEPTTCFLEIAQDPLYTAGPGTLLDDLITAAGGKNVVAEQGYVGYSLEQLVTDNPQVYLATLGSMSNPADLAQRAGYEKLAAVESGRVFSLEDNLVSRPGPRVVDGVLQIAKALHPDLF